MAELPSKRWRVILAHLCDSILLVLIAAFVMRFLQQPLHDELDPITKHFGIFEHCGVLFFTALVFAAICIARPQIIRSVVCGLGAFPKHIGVVAKSLAALWAVGLLNVIFESELPYEAWIWQATPWLIAVCAVAWCIVNLLLIHTS